MNVLPLVSVVIIGRNEGPRLSRCLASVRAADAQAFTLEILYVDSASSDDSVARARYVRSGGTAAAKAWRTTRRWTPSFRATPLIVPTPN